MTFLRLGKAKLNCPWRRDMHDTAIARRALQTLQLREMHGSKESLSNEARRGSDASHGRGSPDASSLEAGVVLKAAGGMGTAAGGNGLTARLLLPFGSRSKI
jgi:hypothetical protein